MTGRWSRWLRTVAGVVVLGAVLLETGAAPFWTGLGSLDAGTLALGVAIAVPTTLACAWRWQLVARGLGVALGLRRAVAACYRAQFLNTTLPGGVLGDVHRGYRHGRDSGRTGAGLRSVLWERVAGQVVQAGLVLAALVVLPTPALDRLPAARWDVLLVVLLGGALVTALVVTLSRGLLGTLPRALVRDVRAGLLARRTWPGVVLASTIAVVGHVATFLVAARAVGVAAPVTSLLPLALLVLLAGGLPVNVAGWGPREGAAAWLFGAAGIGTAEGVATAVAFGVMVLVANLPGALVLLAGSRTPEAARAGSPESPLTATGQVTGHG
jgi:uncharacterized membrane protein YbhN (UPF0104 family)